MPAIGVVFQRSLLLVAVVAGAACSNSSEPSTPANELDSNGYLRFTHLTTGALTTCGIAVSGRVYCWGSQPGVVPGSVSNVFDNYGSSVPRPINSSERFESLAPVEADDGMCGITLDHAMYCSGVAGVAPQGRATLGEQWREIHAVSDGTLVCALTVDGRAFCGGNLGDEVGVSEYGTGEVTPTGPVWPPKPVVGGHRFKTLATASGHVCGLTVEGDTYCWGEDVQGSLGIGTPPRTCVGDVGRKYGSTYQTFGCSPTPARIANDPGFQTLVDACGLTADGHAYCLRDSSAKPVMPDARFIALSTAIGVCGLLTSGTEIHCTTAVPAFTDPGPEDQPSQITGIPKATSLEMSLRGGCITVATGEAYCWGYNPTGQVGVEPGNACPVAGLTEPCEPRPVPVQRPVASEP